MKSQLKRAALLFIGWTFIAVGIVGLFLPILQGILFILIGLLILSTEYVWAHRLLQRVRHKFPKLVHLVDAAEEHGRGWIRRFRGRAPKADAAGADD